MKTFRKVVKRLTERNLTIATMESCTGGGVANAITNIEGASSILKYSVVTYSNEFKIKCNVDSSLIYKFSVYSNEVARSMAKNIALLACANIGVGITGKLNKPDENNNFGKDNEVFVSIYFNDTYYDLKICVDKKTRKQNKDYVINEIITKLEELLYEED